MHQLAGSSVWGCGVAVLVMTLAAPTVQAKELVHVTTHKGHRVMEVYTPVAHAKGHTFFVMPDKDDRPVVTHIAADGGATGTKWIGIAGFAFASLLLV